MREGKSALTGGEPVCEGSSSELRLTRGLNSRIGVILNAWSVTSSCVYEAPGRVEGKIQSFKWKHLLVPCYRRLNRHPTPLITLIFINSCDFLHKTEVCSARTVPIPRLCQSQMPSMACQIRMPHGTVCHDLGLNKIRLLVKTLRRVKKTEYKEKKST